MPGGVGSTDLQRERSPSTLPLSLPPENKAVRKNEGSLTLT